MSACWWWRTGAETEVQPLLTCCSSLLVWRPVSPARNTVRERRQYKVFLIWILPSTTFNQFKSIKNDTIYLFMISHFIFSLFFLRSKISNFLIENLILSIHLIIFNHLKKYSCDSVILRALITIISYISVIGIKYRELHYLVLYRKWFLQVLALDNSRNVM